jgi:FkbM family methyltransferase
MNLLHSLRERMHPLHQLRKFKFFQAIPRYFDPAIMWRLPQLPRPICLRVISHASLMFDAATQEASIRETFVAVLRVLSRHGSFWDIGANIGCFTWYCATTRPDFEIVSFEPDAKNTACLYRTSRVWKLPRHTIVPRAVAENTGPAVFFVDDLSGATGTLEEEAKTFNQFHYGRAPRQVQVDAVALDDFISGQGTPPSIMKIDVEGAEFRVLKGASNLISQFCPILFFETFTHREEIVTFLSKFGYQFYDSDRRQHPIDATVNFIAIVPDRCQPATIVLSELGYPIDR